ncbi:MAG: BCCT family transporter [Gammaproteobacteria bacterium]|nr:BCCT family transporter [Gammaproteobacteria bacterium]
MNPSDETPDNTIHAPVFYTSIAIIVGFFIVVLANLTTARATFSSIQLYATDTFGWLLILTVNILLMFCAYLAISRWGPVRLGGSDAQPQFSTATWFAMLFSAGMGIGLVFFGVAEPLTHFAHPPKPPPPHLASTAAIAGEAMGVTFLHWGLHAWAIYAVIGLALAYASFNRGLPLTISSILSVLLPTRLPLLSHLVDVLAVVATVCGVAASLGLGAAQINSGLGYLFDIDQGTFSQLIIIGIVALIATLSVASGLERGIRRLSEVNMSLAGILLLFILIAGPTVFILDGLVQNTGYYIQNFFRLATWSETYTDTSWQNGWTVFYWAWWISWSPFVGMFIARISYGRTIREFILGVLFVPTALTFLWMTVFGNSALYQEMFSAGGIATVVDKSVADSMFIFLGQYPIATITTFLTVIIIVTFFVTSADSGALVTDIIASGGHANRGVFQRSLWAISLGAMAAILLAGGGLEALQTAAIVTGLPFAAVLIVMCFAIRKMLGQDYPQMRPRHR